MNEKSGRDLKSSVSNQKCAEDPTQVGVIDGELFAYLDAGDRNIGSVEIGDCT
jgi:hypothetical protein